MADWSSQQMCIQNGIKVATCSTAPALRVGPQETVSQKQDTTPDDSINAPQIYNASESKEPILKRNLQVRQKTLAKRRTVERKQCRLMRNTIKRNQTSSR